MQISVERLKKAPGELFEYVFAESAAALGLADEGVHFREPLVVKLAAAYYNGKVLLKGNLCARVVLACSRCLQRFSCTLESGFEEEIQVDDEPVLDLAELVREIYFADFPLKPLCDDSCRGLCPSCGTDLNVKQCDCEPEQVDHRMSILKKLLEK